MLVETMPLGGGPGARHRAGTLPQGSPILTTPPPHPVLTPLKAQVVGPSPRGAQPPWEH